MHEVFITRGDIAGNDELMEKIMAPWNCVLVHHGKCHIEAATKHGQEECISYLLYKRGYISIMQELSELNECMKGNQAENAMRAVTTLCSRLRQ